MYRLIFLLLLFLFTNARNIGTFLQITDIHYDNFYTENAPNNCVLGNIGLGCCRKDSIPVVPYQNASAWGDYNCDSPFLFIDQSFMWIKNNIVTPDFVIWNGDNTDHHDITQSFEHNMEETANVTELLSKYFPEIMIIPMIGNHDTYPVDQLWYNFNETRLSGYLSKLWNNMIPVDQSDIFRNGGYYSIEYTPEGSSTLRNTSPEKSSTSYTKFIIINSLLYDKNNLFINGISDPSGQNKWLETELFNARQNGINVWIMGHIPIGCEESPQRFTDYFYNLTLEYSDVIKYQFWGHSHEDYFYLIGQNKGFSFVTPSIVPDHRFASFREYSYDRDTMIILNYIQYSANLSDIIRNDEMAYTIEYIASDEYNLTEITPSSFYDLYNRLSVNDTLIQKYHQHYVPGFNNGICDDPCKKRYLSEIINIQGQ